MTNLFHGPISDEAGFLTTSFRTVMEPVTRSLRACLPVRAVLLKAHEERFGLYGPLTAFFDLTAEQSEHAIKSQAEILSTRVPQDGDGNGAPVAIDDRVLYRIALTRDGGQQIGAMILVFDDMQLPAPAATLQDLLPLMTIAVEAFCAKIALEFDAQASARRIERLERVAQTDRLTGLENSVSFEVKASHALLQCEETRGLILLDIDHFKSVNDLYGHRLGDAYLKSVAEAVRQACPDAALIGRVGGDEYAVMVDLPRGGRRAIEDLMSHCRSAIMRAAAMLGKPDLGRVSFGAAIFPDHASDYATLFDLADSALYASKNAGRGGQTLFEPDQHAPFNQRALQSQFFDALDDDRIVPYFQPIHNLDNGACTGFEVLTRWLDPERGVLEPESFTSILEDHRFAEKLTQRITRAALATLSDGPWRTDPTLTVAINFTSFDLLNPECVFEFQSILSDTGTDWRSVVVEVTERVMLGPRTRQIFSTLEEMRRRGARVALDDFGTGHAGLKHLSSWPVDILKIDRQFVNRIDNHATDAAIVEALISLAEASGYSVVAEGIETPHQLDRLMRMGCPLGQGYLFSRPVPEAGLRAIHRRIDLQAAMPRRKLRVRAR